MSDVGFGYYVPRTPVLYHSLHTHTCHEQIGNESHSDVFKPRDVHDTPAEACRDRCKAAVLDLRKEYVVLVGELLVVLADLADDAV